MIRSLVIEGYRGFDRFEMDDLGRVNLLVGRNNSGKTSILEAIALVVSEGNAYQLWRTMVERGETIPRKQDPGARPDDCEVCHLFGGHQIAPGSKFSIRTHSTFPAQNLTCMITERDQGKLAFEEGEHFDSGLALHVQIREGRSVDIELSSEGLLSFDTARTHRRRRDSQENAVPLQFIASESMSIGVAASLWTPVALTPEETLVTEALRAIDAGIERIAFTGSERYPYPAWRSRGGFVVKHRSSERPVPIGSLGDGLWRMLALALASLGTRGGVLLVDEIDTGFHHTVMEDVWKLMARIAKDFNLQVFATTHSYDCVHALASICREELSAESTVSIQRIEPERGKAVAFSAPEIAAAAERNIEIR